MISFTINDRSKILFLRLYRNILFIFKAIRGHIEATSKLCQFHSLLL